MDIYLGFDPGGKKKFGWAVCESTGQTLHVLATGTGKAGHTEEAVTAALSKIPKAGNVIGVGIDAPLFWVENGERTVDKLVRDEITKLKAPYPWGTVQKINSLRGSCLVQGVLLANRLHQDYLEIAITESHPKALIYLLKIKMTEKKPGLVLNTKALATCLDYNEEWGKWKDNKEHERDAILGAVTAFARHEKRKEWKNILEDEQNVPVVPFKYKPEYWMPLP